MLKNIPTASVARSMSMNGKTTIADASR